MTIKPVKYRVSITLFDSDNVHYPVIVREGSMFANSLDEGFTAISSYYGLQGGVELSKQ